jgi:hypothetical protein
MFLKALFVFAGTNEIVADSEAEVINAFFYPVLDNILPILAHRPFPHFFLIN